MAEKISKTGKGGARPGAGRPQKILGAVMVRLNVRVTKETHERMLAIAARDRLTLGQVMELAVTKLEVPES